MTGQSSSRPTVGSNKKLKPHDTHSHYFCIHHPANGTPLYVIAKSTIFPSTGLGNGYLVLAVFLLKISLTFIFCLFLQNFA